MTFVRQVEKLSQLLGIVAMVQVMALTVAMGFEVVCRFGFNAPNLWSFDIAYMLAGTLFFIGAAYTLKENAHVRIDFLSNRLPPEVRFSIEVTFYALLFLPMLGVITYNVSEKAWRALVSGEVNYTSPWAPVMWPFYAALAIGLMGLWLQGLAEVIRSIWQQRQG